MYLGKPYVGGSSALFKQTFHLDAFASPDHPKTNKFKPKCSPIHHEPPVEKDEKVRCLFSSEKKNITAQKRSQSRLVGSYCWWLKSCTTWDVWNPINNGINYLSTGAGFQPSTVSLCCCGGVTYETQRGAVSLAPSPLHRVPPTTGITSTPCLRLLMPRKRNG